MSTSILSSPHFHNEEAAYEFVEARLWANGTTCPHCGVIDQAGKLQGKFTRTGKITSRLKAQKYVTHCPTTAPKQQVSYKLFN